MSCPDSIKRELLKCVPSCILSQEQIIQLVRETNLTFSEIRYHAEHFRYKVPPEMRQAWLQQAVPSQLTLKITDREPVRAVRSAKGLQFSVLDFIWNVSMHANRQAVAKAWSRMISDGSEFRDELLALTTYNSFYKEKSTPCMDAAGLQRLLVVLGASVCEAYRRIAEATLASVASGDPSAVSEPMDEDPKQLGDPTFNEAKFWREQFRLKHDELEIERAKAAAEIGEYKRQVAEDRQCMKEIHLSVMRMIEAFSARTTC